MSDTHISRSGPERRVTATGRRKASMTAAQGAGAPTVHKPVKSIGRNESTHYDEHGRKRKR